MGKSLADFSPNYIFFFWRSPIRFFKDFVEFREEALAGRDFDFLLSRPVRIMASDFDPRAATMASIFGGDISDTSDEEDTVPFFADKVKSNTVQRENNNANPTSQQRNLTDLKQQNFRPNNVMPDRPCTAFFKIDEFMAANDFFAFLKQKASQQPQLDVSNEVQTDIILSRLLTLR